MKNIIFLAIGSLFGLTLVRSQVISWYRIQEMFLFDNFHMYGVIGTAVFTAGFTLALLKKYQTKTFSNEDITIKSKPFTKGTIPGGLLFGLGWSIIGACPGPLYALAGNGAFIYLFGIAGALLGVITYGYSLGSKNSG